MNYLPVLFGYEASNIGNSMLRFLSAAIGMKAAGLSNSLYPEQ